MISDPDICLDTLGINYYIYDLDFVEQGRFVVEAEIFKWKATST